MRAGRSRADRPDTASGTTRVRAEVHDGLEQTMLGIVRALAVVGTPSDAAYGRIWAQQTDDRHLLVGSRAEAGHGFRAVIGLTRGRGRTDVEYAITRLPGGDALHSAVLQFELLLIEALRRLDPDADVRLLGTALRDLERTRAVQDGGR